MDAKETIDYCIDSAIKIGKKTYDMVLDFSDESVEYIDKILDGYHERYCERQFSEAMTAISGPCRYKWEVFYARHWILYL